MKRILFSIITVLVVFQIKVLAQDTIRVLAIGNSFSEDAVENYLYELGQSENITFIIGNLYIGGCSLEKHWMNSQKDTAAYSFRKIDEKGVKSTTMTLSISEGIDNENWDYISLQQNSGSSGLIDTYFPYLPDLLNYVKARAANPNVKYIFHQTWAYASSSTHGDFPRYGKNQKKMYKAIVNTVNNATDKVGISIIVPSGTAIQNGRSSYIGDNFCRDGYHLSYPLGRYTAACTWFEILSGKSVVGNKFIPSNISGAEATIAQKAASCAVISPNKVTSLAKERP